MSPMGAGHFLRTVARRAGFGRNPLRRRIDRVEVVAALVAIAVTVAVLPAAFALGSAVRARSLATAAAETAARHQVVAVLTATTGTGTDGAGAVSPVLTPGRWRLPDGSTHTGLVWAPPGAAAGSRVSIWVDPAGRPTTEPLTADQAYWRGALTVLGAMLGAITVLLGLLGTLRWRLNRRRYRMWADEWDHFGPQWTSRPG